jgi:hypothetical protein
MTKSDKSEWTIPSTARTVGIEANDTLVVATDRPRISFGLTAPRFRLAPVVPVRRLGGVSRTGAHHSTTPIGPVDWFELDPS